MFSNPEIVRRVAESVAAKHASVHVEYPILRKDIPDHALPIIPPSEVSLRNGKSDPTICEQNFR